MAFAGKGGPGGQPRRQYGNSGDSEAQASGGGKPQYPARPWTDHAKQALQALLKSDRINQSTRELLTKYADNRNPSNNMVCTVYKIYCEKFHRPTKDYTIQMWQPDGEPQERGPRQNEGREQPPAAPRATAEDKPARSGFGKDRWGDGGEQREGAEGQSNE